MPSDVQTLLSNLLVLSHAYQDGVASWIFNSTVNSISNLIPSPYAIYPLGYPAEQRWALTPSIFLAFLVYDGVSPVNPGNTLAKSKLLYERGLAYVRTSSNWADNNDVQFGIEGHQLVNPTNGVYSDGHTQSDKNHFLLNAYGDKFIIDYGYDSYLPQDHNYILIDRKGEAVNPYGFTGGSIWGSVGSSDLRMVGSSQYSFIHGDAKRAFDNLYEHASSSAGYTLRGISDPAFAPYVNPVQNADRYVMFNQAEGSIPPYVVIADDIKKDNSYHDFQWLFHTNDTPTGTDPVQVSGYNGSLKIWHTSAATISISTMAVSLTPPSPIPPDLLGPLPTPPYGYSNSFTTHAVNPYFHVILYPYKTGGQQPTVTYPTSSGGSAVKLVWSGYEDCSLFRYGGSTVTSANITTDAKLAQIRKTTSGQITSLAIGEGKSLTDGGISLV